MLNVAVLGSGAWGTTLARVMAEKGHAVMLWEHDAERAQRMQHERVNATFLPGSVLPPALTITADIGAALYRADAVLFIVPAQQMRQNARLAAPFIAPDALVITGGKGIELTTMARMTQILHDELLPGAHDRLAALSGPNLAREIAEGKPAATVVASTNAATARQAQALLATGALRVYTTDDVIGVELGGALKNVIAIGIGCADGLGGGDNAKASLMTRGLAEIVRLAVAQGGHPLTLAGLAGLGDLIATCSSPLSRNYSLGRELTASGRPLAAILAGRHSVAEGIMTARAALLMAAASGIEMPITAALCHFFDGADAHMLIAGLLQRESRPERDV